MLSVMPEHSLKSMAEVVGTLPGGDIPAAWYLSLDPEVLAKYEQWRQAYAAWKDRYTELCERNGIAPTTKYRRLGEDTVLGIDGTAELNPTWWRKTKEGYWVPRKRTRAEKTSEAFQRFHAARRIPNAFRYVPGIASSVWIEGKGNDWATHVYPVHLRKPGQAVLAFVGVNPDHACPPFEVGPQWSRMKLSVYHQLRERQEGEGD